MPLLEEIGGVVTRVGDETVGEMWSLFDGQDVLDEVDPQFSKNIRNHVDKVLRNDPFHVSANTDPKGDRSKPPQEQDPDMLLHVVKETDAGIVVRGAKFETAAAYANQAFTKPTIANWGNDALSDYAVGFICDFNSPNLKFICRTGFAGRAPKEDYPIANRFDEVDALVIFDNVLIPWENVLFYRHTKAASFIRSTLHRYSAFAFTQRVLKLADMMIGAALFNVRQTGLDKQQAVQEKLAELAVYREGINAHLTASIALAERSPGGLMMPNQSLLFTGRVLASSQLHHMMHHRPRAVRRPDLRHARQGGFRRPGDQALARQVLHGERGLAGRGPPQASGLRARSAELRQCRPSPDLPALRPVGALRQPGRGLPQLRLGRPAGLRPEIGRAVGAGAGLGRSGRFRQGAGAMGRGERGESRRTNHCCHPERSEAISWRISNERAARNRHEILRCAQDDMTPARSC